MQPNWSCQPAAVLKWFAAMVSYMQATDVERFLMHILSPVYRIVDDDTVRDPQMGKLCTLSRCNFMLTFVTEELKTLAIELQDLVQSKVGTTTFANVYNSIRQKVLTVRRDRRTARVIQVGTRRSWLICKLTLCLSTRQTLLLRQTGSSIGTPPRRKVGSGRTSCICEWIFLSVTACLSCVYLRQGKGKTKRRRAD